MLILHDAALSQDSAEPRCTSRRRDVFERTAIWMARWLSGRDGFYFAFILILAWVAIGPYCQFHQSWSTAFSVVTTSISFLLFFFIRHVQNRESKAVHLKLDELIYAVKNARNELISIEHLSEEQLDHLGHRYVKLAGHYRNTQPESSPLSVPGDRPNLILDDFLSRAWVGNTLGCSAATAAAGKTARQSR